jgi:beta-glucosidase
LLVNDKHLLPLDICSLSQIAVIGDNSTIGGTGSGHVQAAYVISPAQGLLAASQAMGCKVKIDYLDGLDVAAAASLAAQSPLVLLTVAVTSGEGSDRESLSLGQQQIDLVNAVCRSNPNTILTVNTPGAILLPFTNDSLGALLISWLPGLEWGNALVDVLIGAMDPGLTLTACHYHSSASYTVLNTM